MDVRAADYYPQGILIILNDSVKSPLVVSLLRNRVAHLALALWELVKAASEPLCAADLTLGKATF